MEKLVVTQSEAAKMLGINAEKLKPLLEDGTIPAYRDGRIWSIPVSLLEKYVIGRALKEAEERKINNEG